MEERAMEERAVRTERTEWGFSKSISERGDDVNNYIVPHELTVTITLREYRSLLTQAADMKVSKYNSDWCEEYAKNQKLQEEVNALREAVRQLKGGENDG
jgi:cell division protein FtsB